MSEQAQDADGLRLLALAESIVDTCRECRLGKTQASLDYNFDNSRAQCIKFVLDVLRAASVPQCDAEPVSWRHPLAMFVAQVESGNPISKDGEAMQCAKLALAAPARCDARSGEAIARVLYECEKRRATNADAVVKAAVPNAPSKTGPIPPSIQHAHRT